jgi:hypothetical protein
MKSILSALALLLTAGLLVSQAGCTDAANDAAPENPALTAPVPAGMLRGTVLETMDSGGYTYVSIETSADPIWAAGPQTSVKVGDIVQIAEGMAMMQFESKTLNRIFDVLYFVGSIDNLTSPAPASQAPTSQAPAMPVAPDVGDVSVAELEPGRNIAYVYANLESLAGQTISLRGKVVKYNSNILGWNFLHIQDGSGDSATGNHDLSVTSTGTTAVGDIVVLTGTVVTEKDFGGGYRFPVLVEDASLTIE